MLNSDDNKTSVTLPKGMVYVILKFVNTGKKYKGLMRMRADDASDMEVMENDASSPECQRT